jgi:glucose/arabinose dehydrogenase
MFKLILIFLFIFSCGQHWSQNFKRSELVVDLNRPWEIVYGPDGYLWVTESQGKISRINPSTGAKQEIYVAPDYFGGSPLENSSLCPELKIGSGTHGLALHPNFQESPTAYIYFLYSYNSGTANNPATKFRIKRLHWDAESQTVIGDSNIVNLIPTGYDHFGGRLMALNRKGIPHLYFTIGDLGPSEDNAPHCYNPQSENPNNYTQDISTFNGKIHRFNMDGSIPADNPVPGNSMYTRGHRNPQGLMYDYKNDLLYDIEHGDNTDDEINVLYPGMNYGWKNVRGYRNDNSYQGEKEYAANYSPSASINNDSLVDPFYSWCTVPTFPDWCTVAPSDGIYYGSTGIPQWTNSLLVVTLKDNPLVDKEVYQFKLNSDGTLVPSTPINPNPKKFFGEDQENNGRLRDIAVSPDGKTFYLINNGGATNNIKVYKYDEDSNPEIKLFPNPSKNIITLEGLEFRPRIKELKVLNTLGQSVQVEFVDYYQINVSKLNQGLHFLYLIYEDRVETLKFVKQ